MAAVGQVQVQMVAMGRVGLRAEYRSEQPASPVVDLAQEDGPRPGIIDVLKARRVGTILYRGSGCCLPFAP